MLSTNNITMQFGSKPLFENISVKFGGGNRYGLIGANGCGKSTFMKILGGDLVPSGGNVFLDPNERLGKLRQDQFAFEQYSVLDTVIMGHTELWAVKEERDRIYALAEMSEEDGYKVADLEVAYGEMDGYTAEARAGELLLGVGIPVEQHYGPMSEIAPGFKLRVLLAQALFSDPEILLLLGDAGGVIHQVGLIDRGNGHAEHVLQIDQQQQAVVGGQRLHITRLAAIGGGGLRQRGDGGGGGAQAEHQGD